MDYSFLKAAASTLNISKTIPFAIFISLTSVIQTTKHATSNVSKMPVGNISTPPLMGGIISEDLMKKMFLLKMSKYTQIKNLFTKWKIVGSTRFAYAP